MAEYADPDVLVSTEWVAEHHGDPTVRIVESNEDRALYTQGHVPGAVEIDWQVDLQDQIVRDYVDRKGFEEICRNNGISNDTTVVFYGDKNNWWACYAFWVFKLYGHPKCKVMNGGRKNGSSRDAPGQLTGRRIRRQPTLPPNKTVLFELLGTKYSSIKKLARILLMFAALRNTLVNACICLTIQMKELFVEVIYQEP